METESKRGFLYVAMSDILDEAEESAKSIREHMPEANIALITDEKIENDLFDVVKVVDNSKRGFEDKPKYIEPIFDKTIYLDTDTYFADDVSEIFEILDNFDMAAVQNVKRDPPQANVPQAFPPFCTGVIAMKDNNETKKILDEWYNNFNKMKDERGIESDLESFHRTIYELDVNFATLAPEYNVQFDFQGYLESKAKILHGRIKGIQTEGKEKSSLDVEDVAKKINNKRGSRVFYTHKGEIKVKKNKRKAIVRVKDSLRRRGLKDTIRKIIKAVFGTKA